jgi:hypothetical protein
MRVPLACWPGQWVSVPLGLSLYLKEAQARQLKLPYQSRSALAREIGDWVATQLPARQVCVLGDGGSAPKEYLHQLPATVHVVGRLLITGKLSALPPPPRGPRRGCPPKKGPVLGSPQTLARKRRGWQPPPTEAGALVQAWTGLGQTVVPGRVIRGVVVRRPTPLRPRAPKRRKPRPPLEAFFTPELTLSVAAILAQYRHRWAVEITLRESHAFAGFGQDQCRKHARVVGANTLRLLLAAARTLGFVEQTRPTGSFALQPSRPWYRQKCAPSHLDIGWACREALPDAGVFPIPRFTPAPAIHQEMSEIALPLAA